MFRLVYRVYHLLARGWLWARRRFTPAGLGLLCALVFTGLMGVDTDNTVTYQAFTLLLCLILVGFSSSVVFRAQFSAERRLPRFGTVGHPLIYTLAIQNRSKQVQSDLTLLEDLADALPEYNQWLAARWAEEKHSFRLRRQRRKIPFRPATLKDQTVPVASPNQAVEVRGELVPLRRGILRFSGVTVARPDPLGLCRAFARVQLPQSMLVLPKRYLVPPIALPGSLKYQQGGVALAANVGQSDEFVALRDYRHGDPLRHIHWRSWAKAGKPVVKEFEDEFFVRHALVLDTFIDHPEAEVFEEAVSVAASFACTLQSQESLLDLLFIGSKAYCFTAGRGLADADQMLEILASVRACEQHSFQELRHLVLDHMQLVSGCICVLLAWDQERRLLVEQLQALGLPVLVFVIVEPGHARSLDPGPLRRQPDRFHVLEIGKIEQGLAALK